MKSKLPKEIFVILDNEGTDDEFLNAVKCADDAAEQGVKKIGGIYVLKQLITVTGVASISPLKRAK